MIRIVDKFDLQLDPSVPIDSGIPLEFAFLLMLMANGASGAHQIDLSFVNPAGELSPKNSIEVEFGPEPDASINITIRARSSVHLDGTHWLKVDADGEELTQVPFRVTLTRTAQGQNA